MPIKKSVNFRTFIQQLAGVTLEKQASADTGYAATYVLKQGGSAISTKINIPKDHLVKSLSLKTCNAANQPEQGFNVGDKYIDVIINTIENDETNQHLYLNVKDLCDDIIVDSSMSDSSTNAVQNKIVKQYIDDSIDNVTVGGGGNIELQSYAKKSELATVALTGSYNDLSNNNHNHMNLVQRSVFDGSEDLDDFIEPGFHSIPTAPSKTISNRPFYEEHNSWTYNKTALFEVKNYKNGNIYVYLQFYYVLSDNYENIFYRKGNSSGWNVWKKLTNMDELDDKVDKVSGKELSANDFTNALKSKLEGVEANANNYSHPASHPASMITGLSDVATSGSYNDLSNKPSIPSANSTASNIKMNGTQNAGSLSSFAKADHVHPVDTSRAAASHSHGVIGNDGTLNNDISAVNKIVVTNSSNQIGTASAIEWKVVPMYKHWTNEQGVYEEIDSIVLRVNEVLHLAQIQVLNISGTLKPGLSTSGTDPDTLVYSHAIPEGYRPTRQLVAPMVTKLGRVLIDSGGDIFFVSNDNNTYTGQNLSSTLMWYYD
ncbi:pyocin knob domain-containing protein [Methanobrevibacter sp.]|uniref:pyocin knob domain-containing protein n=1 Tax=Methanobrevibacter sp. TaxID=66852 RepID=UPI0038904277